MTPDQGHVVADFRFAMVPEWVLYADVSAQAVRLYAVLLRYANGSTSGEAYPGRRRLAEHLRVADVKTVDRALDQLTGIGALTIAKRPSSTGFPQNLYTVRSIPVPPSGISAPSGMSAPSPSGISATRVIATSERDQVGEVPHQAEPASRGSSPRDVMCPVCSSWHVPGQVCRGAVPAPSSLRDAVAGRRPRGRRQSAWERRGPQA